MDVKAEDDDMEAIEKESERGWRGRERIDRDRDRNSQLFRQLKNVTGNPNNTADDVKEVDKVCC